jgi:hypothetical protein
VSINENIYDLINNYFDVGEESISIIEKQIDGDLQLEYFECSKNQDNNKSEHEIILEKDLIFDDSVSVDQKKILLVQLASVNNVKAYRTIEEYLKTPNVKLFEWAYLALQESRILLESKLLEENKVLITTGLGGKGNKLRYFIVFFTGDGASFTPLQQEIINNELNYAFKSIDAEVEDIIFEDSFALVLSIVPIHIPVQRLFDSIISECNEFGEFLFKDYIITNLKVLSLDEIREFLALNNIF